MNSPIGYIPYNESHRPTDNGVNLNESVERDIRKHALHKGRNDYGNKNTNRYLVISPSGGNPTEICGSSASRSVSLLSESQVKYFPEANSDFCGPIWHHSRKGLGPFPFAAKPHIPSTRTGTEAAPTREKNRDGLSTTSFFRLTYDLKRPGLRSRGRALPSE